MLKKRVVATVIVKDGIAVQSINFKKFLPIGKPHIAIEFLNSWGIDEIILLDISATKDKRGPNFEMIKKCSEKCFVPLTVGGGINCLDHIDKLMGCGSDKIAINNGAINNIDLISKAAKKFGNQCVVVSVDAKKNRNNYKVFDYTSKKMLDTSPLDFSKKIIDYGAGEIYINSVDRDGSYMGYDINLIKPISQLDVPVICCGGAKCAQDFSEIFKKTDVSGAAAANFFHFYEHSVIITKSLIKDKNIRIETNANYMDSSVDNFYRLNKKSEIYLKKLLNIKIEKEII